MFVQFVLEAACSLRGAGGVLGLLRGVLPDLTRRPAANTGQAWLLRIGLYELQRPKPPADDWVWIIDHTVQIGTVKCLLIVACRLSAWRAEARPLEHRDLSVLTLEPVEKSDGSIVFEQLQQTCRQTGLVPRSIVSDEGTDLKDGIRRFCGEHPCTVASLDIAHQAAKQLKRELEGDERWAKFLSLCGGAKQRLAQTSLAHLLPPTPRSKARYMNLEELVNWGRRTLAYVDHPRPTGEGPVDRDKLEDKLGWLAEYRAALAEWSAATAAISRVLHYVRKEGYHAGAAEALQTQGGLGDGSTLGGRLTARLIDFVRTQSAAARAGEHLIGSSECLESLIGKGKRLEGQQSRSGFTKMILGLAAAVTEPTREYVTRALTAVKTQDVKDWCREHLGLSVQSKRRRAFNLCGTKPG